MNKITASRVFRFAAMALGAIAATVAMSSIASAQHCGYRGGYGGYGHGHGYRGTGISIGIGSGYGGISVGYGGYGYGSGYYPRSYSSYRGPWYHDTTHLDYHPGRHVRHGNHFDYIPGHYDVHRTGHWHR